MIRFALEEACQLGVSELLRLGCEKIALYNAPHTPAKDVFKGALSTHGASEHILKSTKAFKFIEPRFGQGYHLVEYGIDEARRLFGPESRPENRPDGVLCVDELFTQGFIVGLSQYGFRPGKHIEVASTRNAGSAVLLPWLGSITALEIDIKKIAAALTSGAQMLATGRVPDRDGWEESVMVEANEGQLRTLSIRPIVSRREERSDTD
jgi:DNA-binding LacI/PurR family transcriptional regulator